MMTRRSGRPADKIKVVKSQPDIALRAVKFFTPKTMQGPEIIKAFIEITGDKECLSTMQPTHVFSQKLFWHAVLFKIGHVDTVCDKMMYFPSMSNEGIQITPIRKRATLLTIPRVRADINNQEIENQLCYSGTVQRIWSQTWKEYPTIANGNRLVTFLPSGGKEIPLFIICKCQKLVLSYKGQQTICMRCNAEDHLTTECPKKSLKLCHLCASEDHQYRDCPERDAENNNIENTEEVVTQRDTEENAVKENNEEVVTRRGDDTTPEERIEASDESERESETITGDDLVIDESQQTPEKRLTYLPQVNQIRAELVKSSARRTRQETPPKERTDDASPKPQRALRKKTAQQSLEKNFNETET